MKRKSRVFLLLVLCGILSLTGCRRKTQETESETQTEKVTEKATEKESETKATEKTTEKSATASRTTVQPKTVTGTSGTKTTTASKTSSSNKTTTASTNTTSNTSASSAGTQMCPYCYQQISLAPNGDGTTVYSVHVAQEKAWADTYGYGDTPPVNQQTSETTATEAPQQQTDSANDIAQCGYCYQWFSISDGSYAAHLASENASLGLPSDTEYITCPRCGNAYPKGSMYDNHVCMTE